MTVVRAVRVGLAGALLSTGCGEDAFTVGAEESAAFSAARCALAKDCCGGDGHAQCEQAAASELSALASLGSSLTYSEECYEEVLASLEAGECADVLSASNCDLAAGAGAHGDDCESVLTPFFSGTTCRAELQCLAGRCVDNPLLAFIRGDIGDYCSPYDPCIPTLFCSPGQICVERVGAGDVCLGPYHCRAEPGLYCSIEDGAAEGRCEDQRMEGENCDYDEQCLLECSDDSCTLHRCVDGQCLLRPIPACDFQG